MVTLVGAGPGNPDLFTVGGQRALRRAEVVLYDRLVGEGVLACIPPHAQRIDVGKRGGHHPVPQDEINALLLEHARAGRRVVRLKGGDPFLFGRGGEEAEWLRAHGIEVRVLPGVSSALAGPASAGIPVTHRDASSSVHIFTGQGKDHAPPDIPYEAAARLGGTLVFLMGVRHLAEICAGLLAAGLDPGTPAAVVQNATGPDQRRLLAPLGELAARARAARVAAPALLVVGHVCARAEAWDPTEALPLWGRRVLCVSTAATAHKLAATLREHGCQVSEFATIATEPVAVDAALWDQLPAYSWLALTSAHGAQRLFEELRAGRRDARALAGLRIAAVGSETGRALEASGLLPDLVPSRYDAACLAEELAARVPPDERVLLLRALDGTPDLPRILGERRVAFDDVALYRTKPAAHPPEELERRLREGAYDAVCFGSASSVQGFAGAFPGLDLRAVPALCIGPSTAAAARDYGMRTHQSEAATVASMTRWLLQHLGRAAGRAGN